VVNLLVNNLKKRIMKTTVKSLQQLLCLFGLAILAGCSGSQNTASSNRENSPAVVDNGYQLVPADHANQSNIMMHPNKDQPSNMDLTDMIQKLPGVRVQGGRGPYASIRVGGPSSFILDTSPLYVVNGNAIGNNYSTVYNIVRPVDVISLSVLNGSDATIYGTRGASGVILIRTR
jgi:TonB-dependent SusC/RagA subfamily outer membrane receptor